MSRAHQDAPARVGLRASAHGRSRTGVRSRALDASLVVTQILEGN